MELREKEGLNCSAVARKRKSESEEEGAMERGETPGGAEVSEEARAEVE